MPKSNSKNLASVIMNSSLAAKVYDAKYQTLDEVDDALDQITAAINCVKRLKFEALANKVLIARQIAEEWLPNELWKRISNECESKSVHNFQIINLDATKEAIARVRKLLFVDEELFKNVICSNVKLIDNDMHSAVRLAISFMWQDPVKCSESPNFNSPEVIVSVPFGLTATIVPPGKIYGGIHIDVIPKDSNYQHTVFSNVYNVELLREFLASTLAIGNIQKTANTNDFEKCMEYDDLEITEPYMYFSKDNFHYYRQHFRYEDIPFS